MKKIKKPIMKKIKKPITKKNSHEFKGKTVVQKGADPRETSLITRRDGKVVRDYFLDGKKVRTEPCG